jgi:hypothetical protein
MCLTIFKCFLIRAVYLLFHHKSAMRFGNGLKVHTSDAQRHNLHQPSATHWYNCLLVLNGSWRLFIVAMGRDTLWALFPSPRWYTHEYGATVEWYWQEKLRTRRKTCPNHSVSNKFHIDLGVNSALRGEKPMTTRRQTILEPVSHTLD